jgi:predicted metal-dependent peptidase
LAAVSGSVDYTYRRPSRRAASTPRVILPSLIRPVPDVAIVLDTSGSMHEGLLAIALAEIETLLTKAGLRSAKARVLAVDTTVQAVSRVARASQVKLAGGGGTDMAEGITAAAALRPRPSIIIILTDGMTPWPPTAPHSVRVIVGLIGDEHHGSQPPTWTRVIPITIQKDVPA